MASFRQIPSIDQLVQRASLQRAAVAHGREAVVNATRTAVREWRDRTGAAEGGAEDVSVWVERRAHELLGAAIAPSLRRVINATGVILHTNLGRAPLSIEARERAAGIGAGYTNLEYDLEAGARGHRHVHAERLLTLLTGAEAGVVVNNNAAATLLVLAALAAGREVIVSRGELVEIGGGFRVPDVMAQSGAVLREVGTTNRTRVSDYAAAISDRTGLLLRVQPSNFQMTGFTERPALEELTALAARFRLPLFEDLGSGWLGVEEAPPALAQEPSARDSVAAGVDVVAFSGDKLLGGPQAGIIAGTLDLVEKIRRHPLMRALRVDKLTCAALEATLALWLQAPARSRIPVYRMLTMRAVEIEERARAMVAALEGLSNIRCDLLDGESTVGGGSAPGSALPTRLIAIEIQGLSASTLESRLRGGDVPVVARIENGRVLIDLRTVGEGEDAELVTAIRNASLA
jgi:L-seryl-tRNA(Ser) seleniumtransferase